MSIIKELIKEELTRQQDGLELIASENYVSNDVLEALGSICTNKYSEGYPGKRYYGGNEVIDKIEQYAIDCAKKLFDVEYVNVQPHSGSPANLAIMMAMLQPGDKILGMKLDNFGHLSHGFKLNFSGKYQTPTFYGVNPETYLVDMTEVRRIAHEEKPKMIIAGFSAYPRDLDWAEFRKIADEVGAILLGDISHIAGLVAARLIENPTRHCHITMTTTHKTLRGPRGAIIMTNDAELDKKLKTAVFPGVQGGPHENTIAAKAVAFEEALKPEFVEYQKQVMKNASFLSDELKKHGFSILTGGTSNHLIMVDLMESFGIGGKDIEKELEDIGISVNKNFIPNDKRSALDPSGIRIGTPALTTRGMKEEEMTEVADIINSLVQNYIQFKKDENNEVDGYSNTKEELKAKVKTLANRFPLPYTV